MKFLAIERDFRDIEPGIAAEILREEALALHRLYVAGLVREFYFTADQEAVLVLECASEAECLKALGMLPLVNRQYLRFEVKELRPYTGFERLF